MCDQMKSNEQYIRVVVYSRMKPSVWPYKLKLLSLAYLVSLYNCYPTYCILLSSS